MKRYILLSLLALAHVLATAEHTVRERIYLQADKGLYMAGERVWLKAVATDMQGRPLDLSKVAYVELLDGSAPRVQLKIEMTDGLGEGSFLLPVALPTGFYRLTAYTRYMRNEGEAVYYDRLLTVVNPFVPLTNAVARDVSGAVQLYAGETGHDASAASSEASPATPAAQPSLHADRSVYPVRTAGALHIEGLPDDIRTLSVSIAGIDSLTLPADASLPATTDGIEAWKRELAGGNLPLSAERQPEYEGHILTGRLVNLSTGNTAAGDKPVALLGFAGRRPRVFGGRVGDDGEVSFFTHRSAGIREVATAVISASPSAYRIDIQSPFAPHTYSPLPSPTLDADRREALLERSVNAQVLQSFADNTESDDDGGALFFTGEPDWRYLLDEYTRFPTMAEVVIEFIPGLRFRKTDDGYALSVLTEERAGFTQGRSMVLLDGIPLIDHELIYNYNPLLVKEIEVYKGRYVFGGTVFDGLAIFRTYRGDAPGLILSGSTQLFSYEGTDAARLFSFPSYLTEGERGSRLPDRRHTLLWQPHVDTPTVPFTTSDISGDFLIRMEGITRSGETISRTMTIRVEE
ncbi:MAG: hypothetical protein LBJ58_05685 [Tannerellaceae bacterium]|jgi:hypothetical protein|nr:hypothetical protein [Tannerellaceae bacterium]